MGWIRHSLVVARLDVKRNIRVVVNRSRPWSAIFYLLIVGALVIGGAYFSYRVGEDLAADAVITDVVDMPGLRGVVAIFWVVIVIAAFALRAVGSRGSVEVTGGLLAEVPTRTVVIGLALAEFVYAIFWFLPPAIAVGIGLALGSGALAPIIFFPLATLLFSVSAIAVGLPVGIALRHVVSRYPFIVRYKNYLVLLIFVGYILAVATGGVSDALAWLTDPMSDTPVGWLGDVMVIGLPGYTPIDSYALITTILTVLAFPLGVAVTAIIANIHWFTDPVLLDSDEHVVDSSAISVRSEQSRSEHILERFFGRQITALVVIAYRRTTRAPLKLLYALTPLLLLSSAIPFTLDAGEVPRFLVIPLLLTIIWAAGTLFVLNPLGDQGNVLPATLLSPVSGRAFITAHIAASLLVAAPIGTVITAVAAFFSPLQTTTSLLIVLASPLLILVGSFVAVGAGMAFPRFSEVNVTQSTKTVVPSKMAFVLYTIYLVFIASATTVIYEESTRELVPLVLSIVLPIDVTIAPETVYWTALIILVPLLLLPVVSIRYAIRRYETYILG